MPDIVPRRLSRTVWRQTRPRNGLLDISDPATYDARYNRVGEPGAWYASLTERGAWAELFPHWGLDEVSPFEIRRRVGRVRVVDLMVLDLTDPTVREAVGIEEEELTGNDWSRCFGHDAYEDAERVPGPDPQVVGTPPAGLGKEVRCHSGADHRRGAQGVVALVMLRLPAEVVLG